VKWAELNAEQARDLHYKINVAADVIRRAFDISQRQAIAFSAGKDSTVLRHLIHATCPEQAQSMPVIYGNTGMEFPECIQFARQLQRDWNLNLVETRPAKTDRPGLKYSAQRIIWQHLIETDRIGEVLKTDGKLKSTDALERACQPALTAQLEQQRLIWPTGTTMSYWWCTDQYGWPILGKAWSRLDARRINIDTFLRYSTSQSADPTLLAYYDTLRQAKISQHCCQALKKEPAERAQEQLGVDLIFKGLMASESRSRAKNFLTRGYLFEGAKKKYLHGRPFFHCQPMAIWTDADVWAYIHRFNVPYASLYDLTYIAQDGSRQNIRRNGCIGCATDFGYANSHLYVLRQTHRKAWDTIMKAGMAHQIRNLQRALNRHHNQLALFDLFPTDELISAQPCVFDDLDGLGGRPAPNDLAHDPEL